VEALVALGVQLARGGVLVKIALGIAVITVLGTLAIALRVALAEKSPPLAEVSVVTSSALAWGAGVLVAFAAAAQSLRRDRDRGIRTLARARGTSTVAYLGGRIGGLSLLLAIVVGGGTLITGAATVLLAARAGLAGRALQGLFASEIYALAFALTMGPLAIAALGARSRAGGYAWLLMLLVLPEVLAPVTGEYVPRAWRDLLSIPSALAGLRASLLPGSGLDVGRLVRASCVLVLFAALCVALARAELARVDAGDGAPP
jgi:hypothetical protein